MYDGLNQGFPGVMQVAGKKESKLVYEYDFSASFGIRCDYDPYETMFVFSRHFHQEEPKQKFRML